MKLAEIADVRMGYPFRSRLEPASSADVAVVQMRDIQDDGSLRTDKLVKIRLPGLREVHRLREGDLVFRSRGRSLVAAPVPEGIGCAVLAAPMLLVRPTAALPEYLCWYLNSPDAEAQLATLARGTAVRMISAEVLKTLSVPVPTLKTQRVIVALAALGQREQQLLSAISSLRQRQLAATLHELAAEDAP